MRTFLLAICVLPALVAAASGCGSGSSSDAKIALLLPEKHARRYESADRPDFEKKVGEICEGCEVISSNAGGLAPRQQEQAEAALRRGAEVLVLDPVDVFAAAAIVEKAKARNVPVLSYDRLVENSEPDAFVAFGEIEVGELQARTLAAKLREEGRAHGPIVMLNGEPADRDEPLFAEGAHRGFSASGVKIAAEHTIPFWEEGIARDIMGETIAELGKHGFAAVYAATDDIAAGAIAAMEAAGIDPAERPTTGQNATAGGIRRIRAGQQYMTVYKPIRREAATAAEIAVDLAEGGEIPPGMVTEKLNNHYTEGTHSHKPGVPSILLKSEAVTKADAASSQPGQ